MTKKSLDKIDVDILIALNKYGFKTSTEKLGKIVNIPSRTLRYRLSKLKENGFLDLYYPLIQERKLGIGEAYVLIQSSLDLIDLKGNFLFLFH